MQLIEQTNLQFDIIKIYQNYLQMRDCYYDDPVPLQINLVHTKHSALLPMVEQMNEGSGSLSGGYGAEVRDSADFTEFNESMKNWYVWNVYQAVQQWSTVPIGRVRFMVVNPHTCYSMHRDGTIRYHLAIVTTPHCFFAYRDGPCMFHIPADTHLYQVDTRTYHTFFNASDMDRLHLVFDTINV